MVVRVLLNGVGEEAFGARPALRMLAVALLAGAWLFPTPLRAQQRVAGPGGHEFTSQADLHIRLRQHGRQPERHRPEEWVAWRNRSSDAMFHTLVTYTWLTDEQCERLRAERAEREARERGNVRRGGS